MRSRRSMKPSCSSACRRTSGDVTPTSVANFEPDHSSPTRSRRALRSTNAGTPAMTSCLSIFTGSAVDCEPNRSQHERPPFGGLSKTYRLNPELLLGLGQIRRGRLGGVLEILETLLGRLVLVVVEV